MCGYNQFADFKGISSLNLLYQKQVYIETV